MGDQHNVRHGTESYYVVGEGLLSESSGGRVTAAAAPPFRFSRIGPRGRSLPESTGKRLASAMTSGGGGGTGIPVRRSGGALRRPDQVARTFHRAIEDSKASIVRDPTWRPTFGPDSSTFRMVDLLLFAFEGKKSLLSPLGGT